MAPMSLGKLEKILGHIKANDQVVAGKISLADFTILQAYIMMCDAKMNSLEAFKTRGRHRDGIGIPADFRSRYLNPGPGPGSRSNPGNF